jgi:predicted outer membrane protein
MGLGWGIKIPDKDILLIPLPTLGIAIFLPHMKKYATLIFLSLILITSWYCSSPSDKSEKKQSLNDTPQDSLETVLISMNEACLASGMLGKLSVQSANEEVKHLANETLASTALMLQDIKTLAASRNITLGDTITKKKATGIQNLEKRKDVGFDRLLLQLLEGEQSDLASSVRQIRAVRNAEIKKFANDHLPVLKENISKLRKLRSSLLKRSDKTARKEKSA